MSKHIVVIEVSVNIDNEGDVEGKTLRVEYYYGNVVGFFLDGEHLFDADWAGNLKEAFEMVLNVWPKEET